MSAKDDKENKDLVVKNNKTYANIVDYAKDLPCNPIVKTNCKLCNSVYRNEAEDMFAEGKTPFHVYKWLKSKKEEISDRAVHNHFVQHYQKPVMQARLKDYAENLQEYAQIRMQEEERLELYSILLDQQIHMLAASINHLDTDETRRSQDSLIKLIDQATKVQEKIRDLRKDSEPVKILVERLNNVMTIKWNSAQNVETKQAIQEILDVIVKEMEAVNVTR